nr:MAG TPA: hypothetical protein [Caudoviricetes sp.]
MDKLRPGYKSRLNRKFQENNYFGTKNETFCSKNEKIKDKIFGNINIIAIFASC